MASRGVLQIADLVFEVSQASLMLTISRDESVGVGISINTKPIQYRGAQWKPYAYLERFPTPARSMQELCRLPIVIPSGAKFGGNTILPDSPACCLCVFEHYFMDDSRIAIHRRQEGTLHVAWVAQCAVHMDKRYGDRLRFKVNARLDSPVVAVLARAMIYLTHQGQFGRIGAWTPNTPQLYSKPSGISPTKTCATSTWFR